jgi:glycosyltransferase involved in cell wall biosynthesis
MLRISESLAKAGYDVWLVGRRMPDSQLFDNQFIKSHRFSLFFNKGKLFYVEYNIRLFFWLLTQRFDIIGGIDLDSILPCYFVAKIHNILRGAKTKVVYDAHELFSETPEVVRRPWVRRVWLAVERFIVPKVDAAYTVSQSVADEFERRYGRRFDLIRNLPLRELKIKNLKLRDTEAIDEELKIKNLELKNGETTNFQSQLADNQQVDAPSDGVILNHPVTTQSIDNQPVVAPFIIHHSSFIILYQGALNEGRGLETAVEAMQFIDNATLWLIGEGDLSKILRGLVERLGLQNKVKFLGFIVPDELPFYTAKADIGLHISEDKGLSYRYSLANKFLDYIQAGIPQICTQFPEYQRLNDAYRVAVLIEKTDVQLLVKALNSLLNDAVFYQEIKENCQKAATVLCWEKEEERLIELYRKM